MSDHCEFCDKIPTKKNQPLSREWFDFYILLESDNFVAIPALGSIVPGYILIVSKEHQYSMAQQHSDRINELLSFCDQIQKYQSKLWVKSVIFEHGACDSDGASSCINHAHWHLVPYYNDLCPGKYKFERIKSFLAYAKGQLSKKPYLLFSKDDNYFISSNNKAEKQIFRRILAKKIGMPGEWDWRYFPFFENISETIRKIRDISNIKNPTLNSYNTLGDSYVESTKYIDRFPLQKFDLNKFINFLKGSFILDAGASSCRDSKYFIELGYKVEAIDLSFQLLNALNSAYENTIKRVMDVKNLAYVSNLFDGIWCNAVLLHLEKDDFITSLYEFNRVLKKNGILFLSVKKGKGLKCIYTVKDIIELREYSFYEVEEVKDYLCQCGFEIKGLIIQKQIDSSGLDTEWINCIASKKT